VLTCSADGCDRAPHCRGMCARCYRRNLRRGNLKVIQPHYSAGAESVAECLTCVDAAHLLGYDSATNIARRVGLGRALGDSAAKEALYQHLDRHGRQDITRRLRQQEAMT
jgi:hypothetical protein